MAKKEQMPKSFEKLVWIAFIMIVFYFFVILPFLIRFQQNWVWITIVILSIIIIGILTSKAKVSS